ncbi:MAG TPA: hypothetical protein VGG75_43160 [Trebonia sp.]
MSLSQREQRILRQTGLSLRDSDPKLAGMLSVFARLAAREKMPTAESLGRSATRGGGLAGLALQALAVAVLVCAVVVPLVATHGTTRSLPGPRASCTTAGTGTRQAPMTSCPASSVRTTRSSSAAQVPQAGP